MNFLIKSTISVTQLKAGTFFEENDQIFEVLSYEHIKMGRGTGNVKLKVKNLKTGAIVTKSFITGAKVLGVEPLKIRAQFLYSDGSKFHFMDSATFEQFEVGKVLIGDKAKFLKEGQDIQILKTGEQVLKVELPKIVELRISETGSSMAGGRETPGTKEAILETGASIQVPMFIKTGDVIKVNTATGTYVERAK